VADLRTQAIERRVKVGQVDGPSHGTRLRFF
jgi:hypothetical protein